MNKASRRKIKILPQKQIKMGSSLSNALATQNADAEEQEQVQPEHTKAAPTPTKVVATTSAKKTRKTVKKKIRFETPVKVDVPQTSTTNSCSPPLKRALIENETICLSSDDDEDFEKSVSRKLSKPAVLSALKDTQTSTQGQSTPRKVLNKKLMAAAASSRKITEFFTKTPSKTPEKPPDDLPKIEDPKPCSQETTASVVVPGQKRIRRLPSVSSAASSSSLLTRCTDQNQDTNQPAKKSKKTKAITNSTKISQITKKYWDEDQKRMTAFYDQTTESPIGYHTRISQSKLPTIITGEVNIEDFLHVNIKEEDRPFDINMQGPELTLDEINAKMQENEMYEKETEAWNLELNNVAVELNEGEMGLSQDSDVEIHPSPEKQVIEVSDDNEAGCSRDAPQERLNKTVVATPVVRRVFGASKKAPAATTSKKGRKTSKQGVVCPAYKIIENTTFAVDGFQFGKIEGVTHYFLTHYHADHYMGLKKSFDMPLILSEITARLVETFIKVNSAHITIIQLHKPITINGVEITALDANHCPGAIMFFFKFPDGTTILHTGDFRASGDMESEPLFWNFNIDAIYLDTTYLSSKYRFCQQSESIDRAMQIVSAHKLKFIGEKFLIICGGYTIGKEKIWTNIARAYNLKVWAEPNRKKALLAINDADMVDLLVGDPIDADLHVLSMQQLYYDNLVEYFAQFDDKFNNVLAIRPSGWEKNSKPQLRGKIHIHGVEYSEHSSYDELERFIRYMRPKTIISTVATGRDLYKTGKVPQEWYQCRIKPKRDFQPSIATYIVASGKKV